MNYNEGITTMIDQQGPSVPETTEQLENIIKTEQNKAEDVAAAFFSLEYPRYVTLINQMSQKEMKRLLIHLAAGELAKENKPLVTELEKQAFYVGNEMIRNRTIMQLHYEMMRVEQAMKQNNNDDNTTKGAVDDSTKEIS